MFYSGRISPTGITEFVLKPVLRPSTPTSDRGRQPEREPSEPSSFRIFTKRRQQCVNDNSEHKTCNSEKTTKQLVIFVFVLSAAHTIFPHIICCKRRLSRVLISKSFHPVRTFSLRGCQNNVTLLSQDPSALRVIAGRVL